MIFPQDQRHLMRGETMALRFTGAQVPPESMLMGVRWDGADPLSTRHVEARMADRGVEVDHATLNRWVSKYRPWREEAWPRRQRPGWMRWRLDETYSTVPGGWHSLSRAVDKYGKTLDLLLPEQREEQAAKQFLPTARRRHGGVPEGSTIDGSAANAAALKRDHATHGTAMDIRQGTSLHHLIEQDPRAVQRVTRPR